MVPVVLPFGRLMFQTGMDGKMASGILMIVGNQWLTWEVTVVASPSLVPVVTAVTSVV